MNAKRCPSCTQTLDLELFGIRNGKPSPYCMECTRKKAKEKYKKDFKKIAARKHAVYILDHPVKKTHIYIPLKTHPPLGTVSKRCPTCNTTLYVCRESKNGTCAKCGASYAVQKTLSDTKRTRGGFQLIKPEPVRALLIPEILSYIQKKQVTFITHISSHFEKPRSTVRNYIRNMESDGLVCTEVIGKYTTVRLTEHGVSECCS